MDLPCIEWQKHVEQKWTRHSPDQKKWFSNLLEIDDVFEFGLSQTTQEDLDFLSNSSKDYIVQRDPERAARCREEGNASFKARDYTAAALHYSQGVCFASQSSEQLSLCYANRSAALIHLQRYQECLEDIARALKHGYPTHLQHKLQDRRSQCLNHLPHRQGGGKQPKQGSEDQREGSRTKREKPNPKPPNSQAKNGADPVSSVSPNVSVCFSPEKGRHLVTTEGIVAGEVILEDRAYSCVLIPGMKRQQETDRAFGTEDRRCHQCLEETVSPVPCEGCSYARYCSEGCRLGAWEGHHRWECPIGAELRAAGVMSQLGLRVALKAGLEEAQRARESIRDENSNSKPITKKTSPKKHSVSFKATSAESKVDDPSTCYYGDSYLSVYHLLPHLSSHAPSMRYLCAVTIATLYLRLSRAGPPPVSWETRKCSSQSHGQEESRGWAAELSLLGCVVLRHMLQLRCNAQAVSMLQDTGERDTMVQSRQEVRIATAIFPTLSVLNHSCCPNTSINFRTGVSADLGSLEPVSTDSVSTDPVSIGLRSSACGVTVTIRAARAIAPAKEILHCYGPHSSRMVFCERQRVLQDQYYFLCQCETCSQEHREGSGGRGERSTAGTDIGMQCGKCKGPLKQCSEGDGRWCVCSCGQRVSRSELDHRLKEIRVNLELAVDLMERDKPDKALSLLQRAVSQSALYLRETHPLEGELADAMARAYAAIGHWQEAASQLERSVVAIGSQYGEDSIELGQQLFKLAQLHFNGGASGPALSVIPKARRLLLLHCGPHCQELQELQAMENCLKGAH